MLELAEISCTLVLKPPNTLSKYHSEVLNYFLKLSLLLSDNTFWENVDRYSN